MAQSYRNVRRVQQLQDTAQLAVDNAQYREQSKRTASRRRNEDTLSGTAQLMDQTVSKGGPVRNDKGESVCYDRNAFKDAQLMMRRAKPQSSFSALQVRTE